jgi:hypothetical protein
MVECPPGEPQEVCAICGEPFERYDPTGFPANYANLVCESCDEEATAETGERARTAAERMNDPDDGTIQIGPDGGDNPVYIRGQKCWRRYKFGGWVTRLDEHDCESVTEFRDAHRNDD